MFFDMCRSRLTRSLWNDAGIDYIYHIADMDSLHSSCLLVPTTLTLSNILDTLDRVFPKHSSATHLVHKSHPYRPSSSRACYNHFLQHYLYQNPLPPSVSLFIMAAVAIIWSSGIPWDQEPKYVAACQCLPQPGDPIAYSKVHHISSLTHIHTETFLDPPRNLGSTPTDVTGFQVGYVTANILRLAQVTTNRLQICTLEHQ